MKLVGCTNSLVKSSAKRSPTSVQNYYATLPIAKIYDEKENAVPPNHADFYVKTIHVPGVAVNIRTSE